MKAQSNKSSGLFDKSLHFNVFHAIPFLSWGLFSCSGLFGTTVPVTPRVIAAADRDSDGIIDKKDACPTKKEDVDGFEDHDGCPDPDNDGDGILDEKDMCPVVAEDLDGFEDHDGCPDPDNDHDGVPDSSDACPVVAEDVDGYMDKDGCPDPDNDGDGIADLHDLCPTMPESFNGIDDEDGCPDLAKVEKCQIVILDKIYFDYDSASIKEESYAILDVVAQIIQSHTEFGVIRIEGHTDNVGGKEYNSKLSKERVLAVAEYLVERGVPSDRLVGIGHGDEKPIASNSTEEGREMNRRVEFHITECK